MERKITTFFGAPLWQMGFRPFFLGAALYAVAFILYMIGGLSGLWPLPSNLSISSFHAHEMLYGFAAAVIAGFLLTASAVWTGTRGLHGVSLVCLVVLWLLGRLGMWAAMAGAHRAWTLFAILFMPALILALAPPLLRAKRWANISILGWLAFMAIGQALFLLETAWIWPSGWGRRGLHLGLGCVLFLIAMIAGRVLPFFSRSALKDQEIQKWPAMDRLALLCTLAYVGAWFFSGELSTWTGVAAALAAATGALRMFTWKPWKAWKASLLWILHAGYVWLLLGFALHAMAVAGLVSWSAVTHALTVGAIGSFCVGMIARVSLGHTGRPLEPSALAVAAFAAILLASFLRVFAAQGPPAWFHRILEASALAWILAFVLLAWVYTPILRAPRVDGKPG